MLRRGFLAGASLSALLAGSALAHPAMISDPAGGAGRTEGPSAVGGSPSLDLNFVNGSAFDPRISFTRASGATYFDATGTLQSATTNTPRIDYGPTPGATPLGLLIEEARTNQVRNPRCEGAVVADGVERVTNGSFALNPLNAAQNTLQNGWQWSVAGGTSTVTWNGSAVLIIGDNTNIARAETSVTTVVGQSYTVTFDIASAQAQLTVSTLAGNTGVTLSNTTPGLGVGQRLQFVATTTTTWIGFAKTSGSTVNLDNVSVQSAGKVPTNWVLNLPAGVVMTVVATGTDSGIGYVDIRYQASAAATQFYTYNDNAMATTAAAVVTYSAYVKLQAGSLTNISTLGLSTQFAGGTGNSNGSLSPTNGALASQRTSTTATAGTGVTSTSVAVAITFFGAGDATLRIGAPQFEVGAFATSLILPAVGTPAASTRAADFATMPVGAWFNPTNMSMAADAMLPAVSTPQQGLMLIDDGSITNRITLRYSGGGPPVSIAAVVAGATTYNTGAGSVVAGTPFKVAAAINPSGASISFNGAAPASGAGASPSGLTTLHLGQNGISTGLTNGYLRRLRYWPRALSNAELQAATT